jgi:hypothetical protein
MTSSTFRAILPKMRFRKNNSLLPSLFAAYICVYTFDVLRSRSIYFPWEISFVAVSTLSVLLFILSHFFTYWELDSTCLRERKLWMKKEIAWQDVTSVRRFGFSSDKVMICYGRVPENCGYILANPSNRDGFIVTLRRFVPEAHFDVFESISKCMPRSGREGHR